MNYAELLARHDALVEGLKSSGCEIAADEHGVVRVRNTRAEKAEKRIEEMKVSGLAMLEQEMTRTRECLRLRAEVDNLAKMDAHWFVTLSKCAKLVDLPEEDGMPAGVVRRGTAVVGERS